MVLQQLMRRQLALAPGLTLAPELALALGLELGLRLVPGPAAPML